MTRKQIEELKAGPEFDALCLEAAGWVWMNHGDCRVLWDPNNPKVLRGDDFNTLKDAQIIPRSVGPFRSAIPWDAPQPSIRIEHAWALFNDKPDWYRFICWEHGAWTVHVTGMIGGQRKGDFKSDVSGDTAEVAICRAYLIARLYS